MGNRQNPVFHAKVGILDEDEFRLPVMIGMGQDGLGAFRVAVFGFGFENRRLSIAVDHEIEFESRFFREIEETGACFVQGVGDEGFVEHPLPHPEVSREDGVGRPVFEKTDEHPDIGGENLVLARDGVYRKRGGWNVQIVGLGDDSGILEIIKRVLSGIFSPLPPDFGNDVSLDLLAQERANLGESAADSGDLARQEERLFVLSPPSPEIILQIPRDAARDLQGEIHVPRQDEILDRLREAPDAKIFPEEALEGFVHRIREGYGLFQGGFEQGNLLIPKPLRPQEFLEIHRAHVERIRAPDRFRRIVADNVSADAEIRARSDEIETPFLLVRFQGEQGPRAILHLVENENGFPRDEVRQGEFDGKFRDDGIDIEFAIKGITKAGVVPKIEIDNDFVPGLVACEFADGMRLARLADALDERRFAVRVAFPCGEPIINVPSQFHFLFFHPWYLWQYYGTFLGKTKRFSWCFSENSERLLTTISENSERFLTTISENSERLFRFCPG